MLRLVLGFALVACIITTAHAMFEAREVVLGNEEAYQFNLPQSRGFGHTIEITGGIHENQEGDATAGVFRRIHIPHQQTGTIEVIVRHVPGNGSATERKSHSQ